MSYPITLINSTQNIGDSLFTLNKNYSTISQWIVDIQNLYYNYWTPIYKFYIQYSTRMDTVISLVQKLSTRWDSFQTTIETCSTKWLQPFSIFYPNLVLTPFTDAAKSDILKWLNATFPINNTDGTLNYVENQEFIVNCYTYYTINKIHTLDHLIDYTNCATHNETIYANCQDKWNDSAVYCSNGGVSCGYSRSCTTSKTSDCYYQDPYRKGVSGSLLSHSDGSLFGVGQVEAYVQSLFTDRIEDKLISLSFIVLDCQWHFNKFYIV
jgi:hypothetical protein